MPDWNEQQRWVTAGGVVGDPSSRENLTRCRDLLRVSLGRCCNSERTRRSFGRRSGGSRWGYCGEWRPEDGYMMAMKLVVDVGSSTVILGRVVTSDREGPRLIDWLWWWIAGGGVVRRFTKEEDWRLIWVFSFVP
ncbi:hypothetical protein NL676_039189 [Syzygium grande]|nr:hypothetical protein NL676_039189 [Syzygium grande]